MLGKISHKPINLIKLNYEYTFSCLNIADSDLEAFEEMLLSAIEIKGQKFKKLIGKDNFLNLNRMLGYSELEANLNLLNDYAVNFYQSKFKNRDCCYCEHSRIEYVYLNPS